MKLLLDLGNSALKWGLWAQGRGLLRVGRIGYDALPDSLGALAKGEGVEPAPVSSAVAASVISQAWERRVEQALKTGGIHDVEWLRSGRSALGLESGYHEPTELGADRWAALLGSLQRAPCGGIIVDIGTAVTVDGVDPQGRHLGGAIFPGAGLLGASLGSGTVRLSVDPEGEAPVLPGRSTQEGISAGIRYGLAGAIDRLECELEAGRRAGPARILTGGGAAPLAPLLSGSWRLVPHLVLEGLGRWAEAHG